MADELAKEVQRPGDLLDGYRLPIGDFRLKPAEIRSYQSPNGDHSNLASKQKTEELFGKADTILPLHNGPLDLPHHVDGKPVETTNADGSKDFVSASYQGHLDDPFTTREGGIFGKHGFTNYSDNQLGRTKDGNPFSMTRGSDGSGEYNLYSAGGTHYKETWGGFSGPAYENITTSRDGTQYSSFSSSSRSIYSETSADGRVINGQVFDEKGQKLSDYQTVKKDSDSFTKFSYNTDGTTEQSIQGQNNYVNRKWDSAGKLINEVVQTDPLGTVANTGDTEMKYDDAGNPL